LTGNNENKTIRRKKVRGQTKLQQSFQNVER